MYFLSVPCLISFHKIPKAIFFVSEYPTTASGKIQKYKLRELATAQLPPDPARN